jgi:acyl-homoserine lactone acylase PvdQ
MGGFSTAPNRLDSRAPRKKHFLYIEAMLLIAAAALPARPRRIVDSVPPLARQVTIYRDRFGIPHVHGRTDAAAAFGFGYAQAEDYFPRLEDNFIRAAGRQAEVVGEPGVFEDQRNRLLEIPALAQAEYLRLDSRMRGIVDGFVAGINYFIARHSTAPKLLHRIEGWHPLAFIRYTYYQNGFAAIGGRGVRPLPLEEADSRGSNGWAISPKRTRDGHALLFINPHLPFFGPGQIYEGHVMSDQGWNFTGYTRFGFPFPYVGHNESAGWVSTDNAADVADLYVEQFDRAADPLAYRYGSGHRRATEWRDSIQVKTPAGLEIRTFLFRKTHHGPIVATRDGKPVALRMARFNSDGWLAEWYAMTRAQNLAEFKAAMRPMNMLFGNAMFADQDGNIFYIYNGAVPRRDPSFDWSQPVDGSDPRTEWKGIHSFDEPPVLTIRPPGGCRTATGPVLLTDCGNGSSRLKYMVTEPDLPGGAVAEILAARETGSRDLERAAFDTKAGGTTACGDDPGRQRRGRAVGSGYLPSTR